jgi:hypothetical protein
LIFRWGGEERCKDCLYNGVYVLLLALEIPRDGYDVMNLDHGAFEVA